MSHKATEWLSEIEPESITHAEFRVLFYLCDCHNPAFGSFPGQTILREKTSLSNGGLNNALSSLEEKGLIRRKKRNEKDTGKRISTRYFLAFERDFHEALTPQTGVWTNSTFDGGLTPLSGGDYLHNGGVTYTDKPVREPVKEPVTREGDLFGEEGKVADQSKAESADEAFDRFWKVYPVQKAKIDARKAWDKAIRKTDPEKIIGAAKVYAGTDDVLRGFGKYPQGWLNGARYDDPDLQPRSAPVMKASEWTFGGKVR